MTSFDTLFEDMYQNIAAHKTQFLGVFFVAVFVSYLALFLVDFIPEPVVLENTEVTADLTASTEDTAKATEAADLASAQAKKEALVVVKEAPVVNVEPLKIIFDSLDREVVVLNPKSREVADLDTALLSGVVRHPDSADFSDKGNIFILGHSSYLPNVFNKNFQAFNGIQHLAWGDTIRLHSKDTEYIYRVDKVYEAKAAEVVVPMDNTKARLTLATCDSFGSTDDRFMVEATLIKTETL